MVWWNLNQLRKSSPACHTYRGFHSHRLTPPVNPLSEVLKEGLPALDAKEQRLRLGQHGRLMSAPFHLYCPELLIADGRLQPDKSVCWLTHEVWLLVTKLSWCTSRSGRSFADFEAKRFFQDWQMRIRTPFNGSFADLPRLGRIGGDSFWTWREQMYRAASSVSPGRLV